MADDSMHLYDLDTDEEFETALRKLSDHTTHNFVVNFDADSALCAANLTPEQIQESVGVTSSMKRPCRWLNVWSSNIDQRASVRALLTSYGVSQRLTYLLCPESPVQVNQNRGTTQTRAAALHMGSITQDLWHFCSIDWGRRYACISFNALFTTAHSRNGALSRQPDAVRVWSALILCDDGTVLSIFNMPQGLNPEEVKTVRKNQINVLKNLSHCYDPSQIERSTFQVDIRPPKSKTASEVNLELPDPFPMASRLFYYIFDDWRATYEFVSDRQHPYRQKLDEFRAKMARAPAVEDVEKLHQIGQQLVTLQRVYQGYEKIVDRLLQRQRLLSSSLWHTAHRRQPESSLLARQWSAPCSSGWSSGRCTVTRRRCVDHRGGRRSEDDQATLQHRCQV